jgi:hypothetical protein
MNRSRRCRFAFTRTFYGFGMRSRRRCDFILVHGLISLSPLSSLSLSLSLSISLLIDAPTKQGDVSFRASPRYERHVAERPDAPNAGCRNFNADVTSRI